MQLTAHFKKRRWFKVRGLFRGENGCAWVLVSLWWRGKHSRRFPHHQRTRAGSDNKMQEVTPPGCSERPWRCLFLFTVTELLLNILTMINSGLGLFLLPVSLAISPSVCLFPKEPLCCFAGKPRPRKLNVLGGSRGGEQSSSLPALQLGWDPNHSRAGGRDADRSCRTDLVIS